MTERQRENGRRWNGNKKPFLGLSAICVLPLLSRHANKNQAWHLRPQTDDQKWSHYSGFHFLLRLKLHPNNRKGVFLADSENGGKILDGVVDFLPLFDPNLATGWTKRAAAWICAQICSLLHWTGSHWPCALRQVLAQLEDYGLVSGNKGYSIAITNALSATPSHFALTILLLITGTKLVLPTITTLHFFFVLW